jgi:FAD:protein FMN transferase
VTTYQSILFRAIKLAPLGLLLLISCKKTPVDEFIFTGKTMGTTYKVKVSPPFKTELSIEEIKHEVDKELIEINQKMSTYIGSSELSIFNKFNKDTAFKLSPQTHGVIKAAQKISRDSGGAYDVTVGPLVNLWGFGPNGAIEKNPSTSDIEKVKSFIGSDKLILSNDLTARKVHPQVYVDLSSIAKGYGVDQISKLLSSLALNTHMVEIGGEVRVQGEKTWKIGIEKPDLRRGNLAKILPLKNSSVATSGTYRNFFLKDGVRYSHTIDPKTLSPIDHHTISVTVVHPECMWADGFATALMVMGHENGIEMAEKLNLTVYFIYEENGIIKELMSSKFRSQFPAIAPKK